jgi:hypothetical protein
MSGGGAELTKGTAVVVSLMWPEKEYELANVMDDGKYMLHGQRCKASSIGSWL